MSNKKLIVKGKHEVELLLQSHYKPENIFLCKDIRDKKLLSKLTEIAESRKVKINLLDAEKFYAKIGRDSQGIAATIDKFPYSLENELLTSAAKLDSCIALALNHIEDPRNLGAIVRTAEVCKSHCIILPKHRSAEMNEWAIRTSQGAAFHIPITIVTNLVSSLKRWKEAGFWVVGLFEKASLRYDKVQYPKKTLLVAGGEDLGLGRLVSENCDELVYLPMKGKTPSLNVSVSVSVVLFEILRQREFS